MSKFCQKPATPEIGLFARPSSLIAADVSFPLSVEQILNMDGKSKTFPEKGEDREGGGIDCKYLALNNPCRRIEGT